jgi:hypothetical protein
MVLPVADFHLALIGVLPRAVRRVRKSLSHFLSTAAPIRMSPLVPYDHSWNSFIARSQPGAALIASTISSSVMARAGAEPRARMTANPARQALGRIARAP